jgi:hypothetical protein
MTRAEIKAKFDEIVAFSQEEKFSIMPVKRYSSGMYARLAFAVAAHLEAEMLIVDAVLAVWDIAFQSKCLGFYTLWGERGCAAHSAYEPCRQHKRPMGEQIFVYEIPNLSLLLGEHNKINVGLDIAFEADCVEDATRVTVSTSGCYRSGKLPIKRAFLLSNCLNLDQNREEVAP